MRTYDRAPSLIAIAIMTAAVPLYADAQTEFVAILNLPDTQEKLSSEGGDVSPTTPEEAAAFIRSEAAKWGKILKDANIPLE